MILTTVFILRYHLLFVIAIYKKYNKNEGGKWSLSNTKYFGSYARIFSNFKSGLFSKESLSQLNKARGIIFKIKSVYILISNREFVKWWGRFRQRVELKGWKGTLGGE